MTARTLAAVWDLIDEDRASDPLEGSLQRVDRGNDRCDRVIAGDAAFSVGEVVEALHQLLRDRQSFELSVSGGEVRVVVGHGSPSVVDASRVEASPAQGSASSAGDNADGGAE